MHSIHSRNSSAPSSSWFSQGSTTSPFVLFDFGDKPSAATAKEPLNGEEAQSERRRRQGK